MADKPLAGGDPEAYQSKEASAGSHAVRINALRAAVFGAIEKQTPAN